MFRKNVKIGPAAKLGPWRKTSLGSYKSTGDCQIYCTISINVEPALAFIEQHNNEFTLTHLVGKACANMIEKYPEVNMLYRLGKLYPREDISIFFQVASETRGEELTGHVVRQANKLSVKGIAEKMRPVVQEIKKGNDVDYKKVKNNLRMLPAFMVGPIMKFLEFVFYDLNIWSPVFGAPRDSFGTMMISNVGSIGLQTGYAPLMSSSRCGILLVLGKVYDKVVYEGGEIKPQKTIDFCWTLDHRLIDGAKGAQMARYLETLLADPEKI